MNWFDKWFMRKSQWAWENAKQTEGKLVASTDDITAHWNNGLRIGINKVIGGYVVGFRTYNPKIDRSDERTYIITSEQDFNTELGKIITQESMRQL